MMRFRHVAQPSVFVFSLILFVAIIGCCSPLIRSQRFRNVENEQTLACDAPSVHGAGCQCRHVIDHFFVFVRAPHRLLPGSFAGRRGIIPLLPQQPTQDVPHSKFHPVPIRPVFAPRLAGPPLMPVPAFSESEVILIPPGEPTHLEPDFNSSEQIPAPIVSPPDDPLDETTIEEPASDPSEMPGEPEADPS